MRRREFLGIGIGTVAWPVVARAQQPGKMQTVGFLVGGTPSSHGRLVAAFAERLRELGWIVTQWHYRCSQASRLVREAPPHVSYDMLCLSSSQEID